MTRAGPTLVGEVHRLREGTWHLTRPLPIVRAGSWYHVVNRGLDGSALFPTPQETAAFVTDLGEIAERLPVEIHAYCAMGTHYHVLARAQEGDLLHAIERLEAGLPVESARARLRRMAFGRHLLQVTRYIHLNPVDARLVLRPSDWEWSSYRGYLDRLDGPRWLKTDAVLGLYGCIGARQLYRRYVEDGAGSIDMWSTCEYVADMSRMIQIRNVPDELHSRLKSRAALEGMSLSDYLLREVRRVAELPGLPELRERLGQRQPVRTRVSPARAVRAERDRR